MLRTKAIEILSDLEHDPITPWEPDHLNALKLGIEALKVIGDLRKTPILQTCQLLKGETAYPQQKLEPLIKPASKG